MTPGDDLLREALIEQVRKALNDVRYRRAYELVAKAADVMREDAEAAVAVMLATRLSAAHQPAPAVMEAGKLTKHPAWYTHDPEAAAWYFAREDRTDPPYLRQIEATAILDIASDGTLAGVELLEPFGQALPPPAPTLDPEAVARVIWDTTRWSPEMPSFAHEYPWDREWPAGHEGLRELILQQASAVCAMAPPADASQSAEVERVGLEQGIAAVRCAMACSSLDDAKVWAQVALDFLTNDEAALAEGATYAASETEGG